MKLVKLSLPFSLAAVAVTACSSSPAPTPPSSPQSVISSVIAQARSQEAQSQTAAPANPVPLLTRAGATVHDMDYTAPGSDIEGDRYVCADLPGTGNPGEQVCVYTFSSQAAQADDLSRNARPADGSQAVVLPLADVWVHPLQDDAGNYVFQVSMRTINSRVHGTIDSAG